MICGESLHKGGKKTRALRQRCKGVTTTERKTEYASRRAKGRTNREPRSVAPSFPLVERRGRHNYRQKSSSHKPNHKKRDLENKTDILPLSSIFEACCRRRLKYSTPV